MPSQPFIKIVATRIDDGSSYYQSLKPYEKIQTWFAVTATISPVGLTFSAGGRKYLLDPRQWDIDLVPAK